MGLLPLDNFLCWKLKIATLAICIFTIVSAYKSMLSFCYAVYLQNSS